MVKCPICGVTYQPVNFRHVCVGEYPKPIEVQVSGYLQEAQGPEPVEPEKTVSVWTWSHDGKGMAGRVAFPLADLPRDRQAMRQMLHERLQGLGDALMAEWECLIAEPVPLTEEQMAKRAAQSPYTDPPEQYSLGPAPYPGKAVP